MKILQECVVRSVGGARPVVLVTWQPHTQVALKQELSSIPPYLLKSSYLLTERGLKLVQFSSSEEAQ